MRKNQNQNTVRFNPPLRIFDAVGSDAATGAKERLERFARPQLQRNVTHANVAKYFAPRSASFGQDV